MALRDRFIISLMKSHAKRGGSLEGPTAGSGSIMSDPARLALLFDGLRLIGTGNGAGALASVVAMHYFASSPHVQLPIKAAAIVYLVGVLIFGIALLGYILGLIQTTDLIDNHLAGREAKDIPWRALNRATDFLVVLTLSGFGFLVSLACFFVGTAAGLYALVQF